MFVGQIAELGIALADLVVDQAAWSQATFGTDAERGPFGPLAHLEREAREAQATCLLVGPGLKPTPEDIAAHKEELADCLLLILDASRRSGVKVMQLVEAAQAKMEVNRARQWPEPQGDTPVEYIKPEGKEKA